VKFLLLNQTFHPDVASTAQHLTDLAVGLADRGHEVTVLTSRRAYDDPEKKFPKRETWRGINIYRVAATGFGKGSKAGRISNFASFTILCALRVLFLPRHDAVVALTSPPLVSFLGTWLARLRRSRFFYWVMDLNPDEAIAANWLKPGSLAANILEQMSLFSFRQAKIVIALDRFMRDRIVAKGVPLEKVAVIPPWAHDGEVKFDADGRGAFRKANGLKGKFVVMYSGNHSPCHPLDTLLEAAQKLAGDSQIVFCFIGGGSEYQKISRMADAGVRDAALLAPCPSWVTTHASNLLCLPYRPLSELAQSLSAADLHVAVMGDPFVGIVHPCKIYNILAVAAPVVCIGPQPSHLSEILDSNDGEYPWACFGHGKSDQVVEYIQKVRKQSEVRNQNGPAPICAQFSKRVLLPRLIQELERG
jgi:colanic acid biosynthesis glycosyl transferase WcaI